MNKVPKVSHPTTVFESHTQKDIAICDVFDRACARVGIKAFRSEYETITPPAWQTIRDALQKSRALFLLVGSALVEEQELHSEEWEYTQNWIAYEIGIASSLGIDIWVVTETRNSINFPVPFFNNYMPYGLGTSINFRYTVKILQHYLDGSTWSISAPNKVTCPHSNCQITFNLHALVQKTGQIKCPSCLKLLQFDNGFLLSNTT